MLLPSQNLGSLQMLLGAWQVHAVWLVGMDVYKQCPHSSKRKSQLQSNFFQFSCPTIHIPWDFC